jgi:hypothetical protein
MDYNVPVPKGAGNRRRSWVPKPTQALPSINDIESPHPPVTFGAGVYQPPLSPPPVFGSGVQSSKTPSSTDSEGEQDYVGTTGHTTDGAMQLPYLSGHRMVNLSLAAGQLATNVPKLGPTTAKAKKQRVNVGSGGSARANQRAAAISASLDKAAAILSGTEDAAAQRTHCRAELRGKCRFGPACKYSHDDATRPVCHYKPCTKSNCRYSHPGLATPPASAVNPNAPNPQPTLPDTDKKTHTKGPYDQSDMVAESEKERDAFIDQYIGRRLELPRKKHFIDLGPQAHKNDRCVHYWYDDVIVYSPWKKAVLLLLLATIVWTAMLIAEILKPEISWGWVPVQLAATIFIAAAIVVIILGDMVMVHHYILFIDVKKFGIADADLRNDHIAIDKLGHRNQKLMRFAYHRKWRCRNGVMSYMQLDRLLRWWHRTTTCGGRRRPIATGDFSFELLAQAANAYNFSAMIDEKTAAKRIDQTIITKGTIPLNRYDTPLGMPVVKNTTKIAFACYMNERRLTDCLPFPIALNH